MLVPCISFVAVAEDAYYDVRKMQEVKIPAALVKGHTKTLILAILKEGPSHGYAITHEIKRRTEGKVAFRIGTLYPILHELEADEMVVGAWVTVSDERPKKVYEITSKGLEELERGLAAWKQMSVAMFQVTGERAHDVKTGAS